jgi:hypothetical protein
MIRTYVGGCHCGAVRYEADLDLSQGTVRCNCSVCSKARAWLAATDGEHFRLLKGQEHLAVYRFGSGNIQHLFCRNCGVKSFGRMQTPDGREMVAVLISCLENMSDAELAALPVAYVNGRNDDFGSAPEITGHL